MFPNCENAWPIQDQNITIHIGPSLQAPPFYTVTFVFTSFEQQTLENGKNYPLWSKTEMENYSRHIWNRMSYPWNTTGFFTNGATAISLN